MSAPYTPAAPPTFPPAFHCSLTASAYWSCSSGLLLSHTTGAPPPAQQPFPNAVPPFSSTGLTQPHAPPPVSPQSFTQAPPFSQPRFSTAPGTSRSHPVIRRPTSFNTALFPKNHKLPISIPPRSLEVHRPPRIHLSFQGACSPNRQFPNPHLTTQVPLQPLTGFPPQVGAPPRPLLVGMQGPPMASQGPPMASHGPPMTPQGPPMAQANHIPLHNLACHLVLSTLPCQGLHHSKECRDILLKQNGEHQRCYR